MFEAASIPILTLERLSALVAIVLAGAGLVLGVRALSRAKGGVSGQGRRFAVMALGLGMCGLLLGGKVVLGGARSGLGTGKGLGGGVVAIVVGSTATALSGTALLRSRTAGRLQ